VSTDPSYLKSSHHARTSSAQSAQAPSPAAGARGRAAAAVASPIGLSLSWAVHRFHLFSRDLPLTPPADCGLALFSGLYLGNSLRGRGAHQSLSGYSHVRQFFWSLAIRPTHFNRHASRVEVWQARDEVWKADKIVPDSNNKRRWGFDALLFDESTCVAALRDVRLACFRTAFANTWICKLLLQLSQCEWSGNDLRAYQCSTLIDGKAYQEAATSRLASIRLQHWGYWPGRVPTPAISDKKSATSGRTKSWYETLALETALQG
ncbi:hypothetical protein THAOC_31683, partial [Thalassiosira oceanica]